MSKFVDDVKTRGQTFFWDKCGSAPACGPHGVRHRGGLNLIQALVLNVGNLDSDGKGEAGVEAPQVREYRGGVSGAEPPVGAVNVRNGTGAKGWPYPAMVVVSTGNGMSR